MSDSVERFVVPSDGCRLEARHYAPGNDAYPGAAVVLVHGLLASADVFDVPGHESISLARALQAAGLRVVTYDQRGAGNSTTTNWTFTLREHAHLDLPSVLAACRARLGIERVVLGGHSLGGLIWLRHLQAQAAASAVAGEPVTVGGFALASPAVFNREDPPWSDFYRRGRAFIQAIDHDRDLIVNRGEFVAAQIRLDWPVLGRLFSPRAIEKAMQLGSGSTFIGGRLRTSPLPSLTYHRDDFDDHVFRGILRSRTFDRAPLALLLELFDEIAGLPADVYHFEAPVPLQLPVLCIGSTRDRLVPLKAVEIFGRQFRSARVLATEAAFGTLSGHVGYLFMDGLREHVFSEVLNHCSSVLTNGH